MSVFDYRARAEAVNAAHAEVRAAFATMPRRIEGDPRTRHWRAALDVFRAALAAGYPPELQEVAEGRSRAQQVGTETLLGFLEADPVFFRSGYMKTKVLRALKGRPLAEAERRRLQALILAAVRSSPWHREFHDYCRAASNVADVPFQTEITALEHDADAEVRLRASMVRAALEGRLSAATRAADVRRLRASADPIPR